MNDSQSPPDAESSPKSGKADAVRRTTLRLRDAEIVATTRRDMFGDGSLLDALAGDPLPRQGEDPGLAADTTVSAEEAEPQPADPESVADEPPQTETPVAPDAAVPAAQAAAAEAELAQSLDAIIDSFPADPASQAEEQAPPEPQADDAHGPEEAGFASDQAPPPTAPERFQVSAIFEGLASSPPHAEDRVPQEEPDGDASLPEGNDASGEHSHDAATPRPAGAATPGLGVPVFFQPPPGAPEPSDWPPLAAPAVEDAHGLDTGEPLEPSEPSSGPHKEAASTQPAPYPEPADWSQPAARAQPAYLKQAREGGAEPFPEPLGWPPYLEPPGSQAVDSDAPLLEPPSLVGRSEPGGGASPSPFPGPPAWPPFPEPPGSEARLSRPEPAGLPPYIELPAYPEGDEEPSASSVPPAFTEPQPPGAAPSFGEVTPVDAPPLAAPREMPGFPDFETSTPALDGAARVDATSKIAAEANATAQVLDNLQRLLDRTVSPAAPQPQQAYSQAQPRHPHNAPFHLPQDEPMPFARGMTPMLPLPLPPPPSERTGSRNVYLLGFLTGLLLSVMAGAALYFLINTS
jgi:hypothetical protein